MANKNPDPVSATLGAADDVTDWLAWNIHGLHHFTTLLQGTMVATIDVEVKVSTAADGTEITLDQLDPADINDKAKVASIVGGLSVRLKVSAYTSGSITGSLYA